jgi:maspardin
MNAIRDLLDTLHARFPWRSAVVSGLKWRWIRTGGPGPRVALLPGAIGDASTFVKVLLSLGERLDLIAVSYPDLSDPGQLADGFAALAKSQGWNPLVVVGSSYGAFWAQHLCKRHPNLVKALLLGNTFARSEDVFEDPAAERRRLLEATGQQVHQQWFDRVKSGPSGELRSLQELMLSERQDTESLRIRMLGVASGKSALPFDSTDTPITTLECDDDPVIPERTRIAMREAFPNAKHIRLTTGGHYPHVLNQDLYEKALLDVAYGIAQSE